MLFRVRNVVLFAATVAGLALTIETEPSAQEAGSVRGRVSIGIPITAKRGTSTYSRSVPTGASATVGTLREYVDVPRFAVIGMPIDTRPRTEPASWADGSVSIVSASPATVAANSTTLRTRKSIGTLHSI